MIKINEVSIKDNLELVAKIKLINEGVTSTGNKFLSLQLEDETGIINAKIWNAEDCKLSLGTIYIFSGSGQEYREKTQLIINQFREVNDGDKIDIDKFFKSAPLNKQDIYAVIKDYVNTIENEVISAITKTILNRYSTEYMSYPAATQNHHSYISGLSFHTMTMLKMAERLLDLYTYLEKDYLYAGVVLHDFAKVIELSNSRAPEYTLEGKLIGHLVLGDEIILEVARELNYQDTEEVLLLRHMVLSHHGRKEWGSPQRPMIPEAEALHFIDNIDSKFEAIREAYTHTEVKSWTKRIPVLDGRSVYRHK
ncbi:HD domain-containing protein [Mycoplasmatota bacterium zrk1]